MAEESIKRATPDKALGVRPLRDHVVVKRLASGGEQADGLMGPDTATESPQQAEVQAVGSGKVLDSGELVAPKVKPGDHILFGKYAGSEIKIDGDEFLILSEDQILGVLDKAPEKKLKFKFGQPSKSPYAADIADPAEAPQPEIDLVQRAADVLGSERVAAWMQKSIPSLGGRTPYSLLGSEQGRRQVDAVLGRIEHGVY